MERGVSAALYICCVQRVSAAMSIVKVTSLPWIHVTSAGLMSVTVLSTGQLQSMLCVSFSAVEIIKTAQLLCSQYSIFATRLVSGQSGTLQCRVFRRRTVTRDVVNLDQPQLRIVFSPGFLLDPPEL